jgi:hypothetical protein
MEPDELGRVFNGAAFFFGGRRPLVFQRSFVWHHVHYLPAAATGSHFLRNVSGWLNNLQVL